MPDLGILPSIIITLFVLAGAVFGALFGLLRGFKRSIVTLTGTITAFILALILAKPIAGALTNMVLGIVDINSLFSGFSEIMEVSPSLDEFIKILPTVIIAPILFIPLFAIIKLIMKIPCGIISLAMGPKSKKRLLGMPLGALQGIISSMVIVLVLTGFISTIDNVINVVEEDNSKITEKIKSSVGEFGKIIDKAKKDPVVGFLCRKAPEKSNLSTSVNFAFSNLTSFTYKNQSSKLNEEIISVFDTVTCLSPVMSNSDLKTWTENGTEITAIKTFASKFNDSVLLKNIGTDFISGIGEKWSNGEKFMGIEAPKIDKNVDPLITSLINTLKDVSVDTVYDDLNTIIDLLNTFAKHEILSGFSGGSGAENIMDTLSGDFVKDILTVLNSNPHGHFNNLIGEVTNLGLRFLATALELPENKEEVYNDVINGIARELNATLATGITEESTVALNAQIETILKTNGINVSKEAATIITNGLVESFDSSDSEVTPENVQAFFQQFATTDNEGTQSNNSGVINLTTGTNNGQNPGDEVDPFAQIAALASPDTMTTSKVTLSDLLVDSSVTFSDKDIDQIGNGFTEITDFVKSFSQVTNKSDINALKDLDLESAGKALDLLKAVPAFANTIDELSSVVLTHIAGPNYEIIEKLKTSDASYESLFATFKSTINVLGNVTGENPTIENNKEAILELLNNLTPETVDVINGVLTEDFISSQGVPTEQAGATTSALNAALSEMANLSEEKREEEVEYISKLFELSVSMSDTNNKAIIGEGGIFKDADDIVDTTINSDIVTAALKEITVDENGEPIKDALNVSDKLTEGDKDEIVGTMEQAYNEAKETASQEELEQIAEKIKYTSNLLDLNIDFFD